GNTPRIIQEDEYYSFGLRKPTGGYDLSNNNRYLYNGKEVQTDLANQYDYGARFYDPVIGRWNAVDPLAEMAFNFSGYNYCNNNPVLLTDPLGLAADSGGIHLQAVTVTAIRDVTKIMYLSGTFFRNLYGKYLDRVGTTNNVYSFNGLLVQSMLHRKDVEINGQLLDKMKRDEDFLRFRNDLIKILRKNSKFRKLKFLNRSGQVQFGGKQFFSQEGLTDETGWAMRNANISADATLKADGTIIINYEIQDTFDLSSQDGRSDTYNNLSGIGGLVYHGLLGGKGDMKVWGHWVEEIK
ncbi:RHS repeat-associated core domain-containing protein, partial [Mucilaginibacter sp. Bleaf8]|uniref:RHS repeat-associated core domain-containing protein n=1 Tax=Mucilaginibacter sp. Bleaf8 TaxID=2834430 RepID=UPI001BCCE32A